MSLASVFLRLYAKRIDKKRNAPIPVPNHIESICDIHYAGNNDPYNYLDIYFTRGISGKLPVIVNVHGGGYIYGSKKGYRPYCLYLAEQGFLVVNFNYHLAPKYKFPTPLIDINMVMQWIEANAETYPIDLNNVFMVGDPAGAQLLSQYAAIYSNTQYEKQFSFHTPKGISIRAIALNCGVYAVEKILGSGQKMRGSRKDYFGKEVDAKTRSMLDVIGNITSDYPPAYIMTTYYDFLKENAKPFYEHLISKGVQAKFVSYGVKGQKNMDHVCHIYISEDNAKKINQDECAFFHRFMIDEKTS